MDEIDIDLRTVAIHEAGHAVASVLLGLGLESVTIVEDEDAVGRLIGHDGPEQYDDGWEEWLKLHAIRALAGIEAENRTRSSDGRRDPAVDDHDHDVVVDVVLMLAGLDSRSAVGDIQSVPRRGARSPRPKLASS